MVGIAVGKEISEKSLYGRLSHASKKNRGAC